MSNELKGIKNFLGNLLTKKTPDEFLEEAKKSDL
jgi:hypothetical protein